MYDGWQLAATGASDQLLECFNQKGDLFESVDSELKAATKCYPCPSCYACSDLAVNANPSPARGFWRRDESERQLIQCSAALATSPCLGGNGPNGTATPCVDGYQGSLCGSCQLGYQPESDGSSVCTSCPKRITSVVHTGLGLLVLFTVAFVMINRTRRCAQPPTIADIIREGPAQSNLESIVQCARILLAFLQVQTLVGSFELHWPGTLTFFFDYISMVSDPYYISRSAYCLRTISGDDFVFQRSLLIMVLPFMISVVIGVWYGWSHFTSIGCKADPSLFYVEAAKIMAKHGSSLGPHDDGEVTMEEVVKELDKDHDGKVSREEFQEWWAQHQDEHISKMELLLADSIILIFLIYPSIMKETLSLFACEGRGPDLTVSVADAGVECYTTKHALWMSFLGVPGLAFFGFVLPLAAAMKILHLKRLELLEDFDMVRKYGFLYRGYEEDYCYWEVFVVARKVLVVVVAVFLKTYGATVQALASLIIVQVALILNIMFAPYDLNVQDRMETLSLATTFFTLVGGLYFHAVNQPGTDPNLRGLTFDLTHALVTSMNGFVLVNMLLVVLQPLVARIQESQWCSVSLLMKKMYPRLFYWRPDRSAGPITPFPLETGLPRVQGGSAEEGPSAAKLAARVAERERGGDAASRLQKKHDQNEKAALTLHKVRGSILGLQKFMPDIRPELDDMLRISDRIDDMVGESTRLQVRIYQWVSEQG
jgi:hypothetical protein